MGFLPEMPPEAGEYSVEIRRESFYLQGEHTYKRTGDAPCPAGCTVDGEHTHGAFGHVEQRHGIFVYPASEEVNQGTVEILLEDLPKIRACLDVIEAHFFARNEAMPWAVTTDA